MGNTVKPPVTVLTAVDVTPKQDNANANRDTLAIAASKPANQAITDKTVRNPVNAEIYATT